MLEKSARSTILRRNAKTPKPPPQLSAEARRIWAAVLSENDITDRAGLLILEAGLTAHDRMRAAQAAIKEHGVVVRDKFGQVKSNPACLTERDSRAAVLSCFKALNLEIDPNAGRR